VERPAPVAQWRKSLTAVRLACVPARLRRSGFNSMLGGLSVHAGQLSTYSEINISGRIRGSACFFLKSVTGH